VRGVVLDRSTRSPVPDVLVSLWNPDGKGDPLAVTGTDGRGQFDTEIPILFGARPAAREVDGAGAQLVRVNRPGDGDRFGPLLTVGVPGRTRGDLVDSVVVYVDDAFSERRRFFGHALDPQGSAIATADLTVADPGGSRRDTVRTDAGGWFAFPLVDEVPARLRLWRQTPTGALVGDWTAEQGPEAALEFAAAREFGVDGKVTGIDAPVAVSGLRVELLDRSGAWVNPVDTATTGESGTFTMTFPALLEVPPQATFALYSQDLRLASQDLDGAWAAGPRAKVTIRLGETTRMVLRGQVLNRSSRRSVPGLRVELWTAGFGTLLQVRTTGPDGDFTCSLTGEAPADVGLRVYASSGLAAEQAVPAAQFSGGQASVFVEVDAEPPAPSSFRVAGRVLQHGAGQLPPALRVEGWDYSPRAGGLVGAAAYAAADGTFEIALPAPAGASSGAVPQLVFRLYAADVLVGTTPGAVTWGPDGTGTAVVELTGTIEDRGEVVLHELGETIADAVNRMQGQLSRYPSTVGTYVVDEMNVSVPVSVRLDGLGQIRTRVVEQVPDGTQVGQVTLRVRPALGVTGPAQPGLPQSLSVLTELTLTMVAALNGLRVYSVEDLVRLAQQPAGRQALVPLLPGVDLDALLAKAALLATPVLPAAVRQALVGLGFASLAAVADATDPEALANALSARIGQPITAGDVREWQRRVQAELAIPLPSDG